MSHIIKVFVVDGQIQKIDHDTLHPNSPRPGAHVTAPPFQRVRWFNDDDNEGTLAVHFDVSPFDPPVRDFTAEPGDSTKWGKLSQPDPDPDTGANPVFPYTISVGKLANDPDIIIDLGTGDGEEEAVTPKKKKAATSKKKAATPKKKAVTPKKKR